MAPPARLIPFSGPIPGTGGTSLTGGICVIPGVGTPEVPLAPLLLLAGAGAGALVFSRRRRRVAA